MKFYGQVKVIQKKKVASDVFKIILERPSAIDVQPGQFFNIDTSSLGGPMLGRPISVSEIGEHTLEFTIKQLGQGTQALNKIKIGEVLTINGPLGNGFNKPLGNKVLIIGGGIGIAPLKGLLETLDLESKEVTVLLGFRESPFMLKDFESLSDKLIVYSEHDIRYTKGYITSALEQEVLGDYTDIYCCGPENMLKATQKVLTKSGVKAQFLMEEKMACGVGACLVCTCKIKSGDFNYKHVRMCKDGPMFMSDEVIFND